MNNSLVLETNVLDSKEQVSKVLSRQVKEVLAIVGMYSVTALIVLATSLTWAV
ncbi:hypothetical protein L4D20_05645 [Vibrio kyushuensis]|uniref:hypothetical protein n=1 Tax=Vibrio kyushuensis TaxID=2910249 RepID=UPI003D15088D